MIPYFLNEIQGLRTYGTYLYERYNLELLRLLYKIYRSKPYSKYKKSMPVFGSDFQAKL